MVEVDVHALQLQVGGAIVAVKTLDVSRTQNIPVGTYWPSPSRPCSPEMFCL